MSSISGIIPGEPWAIEATELHEATGKPLGDCINTVILDWLKAGDTRPLAAWLALGRAPATDTLHYLARMLHPQDRTEDDVPYRLIIVSRTGQRGARRDRVDDVRDRKLHAIYELRMEDGKPSKVVIKDMSEEFDISEATIKAAVTKGRKRARE